jgi:hypothetical protein
MIIIFFFLLNERDGDGESGGNADVYYGVNINY